MVLTGAQVRAQATAQQQEIPEAAIVVVDHSDETAVAEVVAERSTVELVPHVQDYLAKLAEYFLTQTQALAEGHTFMQIQLEGQGEAQSSALLADRESTDAGIKQLANQQLAIAGRFHEELMATHASIREQFLRLETMQANVGEEIERSVADKLFRALREAHSESQSMIAAQVDGVARVEQQVDAKIGSGLQVLISHIHQLVEEEIATHQARAIEMTTELTQQLVKKSTAQMKDHFGRSFELVFKLARDDLKQELTSNTITSDGTSHDAVKSFVLEEIEKSKRHFEAQVQQALISTQSDLNLQAQRQADAVSILREKLQQHCDRVPEIRDIVDEAEACNTIKDLVEKEVEKRMELVQRQLLTAHPQTGRCTEISDIKVEHDVAGEVGQRLTEVRIDDISEQAKQTVENSVKLIHDLVREAIRRYACVSGDTGDGSGDVGDEDDEDLSKEDRSIQQGMRYALVKAHASALPSQLKVEAENENLSFPK
ncbi:hypothetical protein GN958_ATG16076 [Phytophthora infestans]|uniref:Uncharacterized protein n=1 Tax=Phytophthora infestans TaxID=4787 RepID=A0A8S9U2I1_PHYIN|nr:hypothetical protein GN958_ATG16076 [Phytophthora infestans]